MQRSGPWLPETQVKRLSKYSGSIIILLACPHTFLDSCFDHCLSQDTRLEAPRSNLAVAFTSKPHPCASLHLALLCPICNSSVLQYVLSPTSLPDEMALKTIVSNKSPLATCKLRFIFLFSKDLELGQIHLDY